MFAKLKFNAVRGGLQLLGTVSPYWAGKIALDMMLTPQHRSGSRGNPVMDSAMRVVIYHGNDRLGGYVWGTDGPTVLLVHGWDGGASNLSAFVVPLRQQGFRVVAFDAPAHGMSRAKQTNLVDYGQAIWEAIEQFGPVYAVIAHSFGASATMLQVAQGLPVNKVITIGAPSRLVDVIAQFTNTFNLSQRVIQSIYQHTLLRIGKPVEAFSVEAVASSVHVPGLVVHDRKDALIPFADAERIMRHWKTARLLETEGLGHRAILRDANVIGAVLDFLSEAERMRLAGD
jgi:pimeloyl-ACP methyl ester carboxylesterase